jgi:tetratricopeptide (TPR) repeat protein
MRIVWIGLVGISLSYFLSACLGPKLPEADSRFLNLDPAVEYTGDASCATCHEELFESYQSHGMAQAFYPLTPDNAVEDFSGITIHHEASGFVYVARRDGDRFVQEEYREEPDGTKSHQLVRPMDYVVGSGTAARTYLAQVNGRLYELPLTWYTQSDSTSSDSTFGHWGFSPGYAEFNNRFARTIPDRCMACHNGASESVPFADGKYGALAEGIGCENCHGPGALHVEARQEVEEAPDSIDVTIVNPAHLSPDLRMDVCQQCHLTGEVTVLREGEDPYSFRPGRPLSAHRAIYSLESRDPEELDVISHADRMKQSACFTESGAMDCVTCHNPHEGFRTSGPDYFNSTCQSCHAPEPLAEQMPTAALRADHSPDANCFSCHMPKVTAFDAPHASFTDHKVRVVREDEVTGPATGGTVLTPYYPYDAEDDVYAGMAYVVLARQRAGAATYRTGIALLDAALEKTPEAGEAQFLLGFARLQMGQAREAVPALEEAVRIEPNPERLNTLAQAYEASGRPAADAEARYREALQIQPAAASIRVNLARLLEAQQRLPEAVAEYRLAIEEEPWLAQAHVLLGGALAKAGDLPGAAETLQMAVQLEPGHADALTNLGAILAQQGQTSQAGSYFGRAVQAEPQNANALANYALYLLNAARPQEAFEYAQRSVQVNPQQATALQVLQVLQQARVGG